MPKTKSYSDNSYAAESLFICPILVDLDGTEGDILSYTPTKGIDIIEAGIMVTELVDADIEAPVVTVNEGAVELFSITVPDTTAVGATVKDIVGESTAIAAGDTVKFVLKTDVDSAGTNAGSGYMYIKYTEQYA